MYRVIVQTKSGISVNLEGNRIVEDDVFFRVYNGEELVGLFGLNDVLFMYRTKSKEGKSE